MKHLLQPIQINHITLNNRLVMPPMATQKSGDGQVSKELIDYYAERAKGGYIGLIITEHAYVCQEGIANRGQVSISKDSDIEGLRRLTDAVHQEGSKIIAQINHAGSSALEDVIGCTPLSASAIANSGATGKSGVIPREMSQEDIKSVIQSFAAAARRAKEAGFDGVEIHSAHAYLLNQFFSPLSNQRTDEYGGSLEGRIKLHLEIIEAIRETVGKDYLVALRLGAADYIEGGNTISDGVAAAKAFEKAGIDLLDISGGFCGIVRPGHNEPGYFSELSEAIKQEVSIPVIVTGGIKESEDAERLLEECKADLIGIGRPILKDATWAKKVIEGIS